MVDAGKRGRVRHRLEGRPGAVGVGGSCHLPGEVNLGLVDAGFFTARPHHRELWVAGVAGGDAHQRVTGGRRLLPAVLDVIVVGERHHLRRHDSNNFVSSPI